MAFFHKNAYTFNVLNLISMTLHVTAESVISDVQQQFQCLFPEFKLEFFFSSSDRFTASTHLQHSFPFIRIRELSNISRRKRLAIKETMTVSELERKFRKKFGLPAMIYMKAGNYWQKKASLGRHKLCPDQINGNYSDFYRVRTPFLSPDFSLQMGG